MKEPMKQEVQQILAKEHESIEQLLYKYDQSSSWLEQENSAETLALELHKHMVMEKEILFPALKSLPGGEPVVENMLKEHDQMKVIISELRRLCADLDEDEYKKKMGELKNEIGKHLDFSEQSVLPKIRGDSNVAVKK